MDENRITYKVLIGKPDGKRLLGRPRRRWEDNIRMTSNIKINNVSKYNT